MLCSHAACGGGDPELQSYTGNADVTATVGPEGAELALDNGVRVTIPQQALSEEVELHVARGADVDGPAPPPGAEVQEPVIMQPYDQQFGGELRVRLPARSVGEGDTRVVRVLRLDDETDETWQDVGEPEVLGEFVELNTDRFGVYAAALVPAESVDTSPDASAPERGDAGITRGMACGRDADCSEGESCFDDNPEQLAFCAAPCATDADCNQGLCYADYGVCITRDDCERNCQAPAVCDGRNLCAQPEAPGP